MEKIYDVIVLGGGAAGLTAGIYSSRAKLSTLILNEGAIGGQMVLTNEIANYPGVEITPGYMLANTMKMQAKQFGAVIKSNLKVKKYNLSERIKTIELEDGRVFYGKTTILAPGGKPRPLNIPGETEFKGSGISYCATCDGDFFNDKEFVVIGGGNSALEEAVSLTKYASKVTIIHQFDHFQAFAHAVDEAKANPKIEMIMETEPREFIGNEKLSSIVLEHLPTKKMYKFKTDGAFIFIGYVPGTENLPKEIKLNSRGEIITDLEMRTNIEGVFAAGDCIEKRFRQVTTAVADGTIAALSAAEFINQNKYEYEKAEIL